jgi:glycosyltransferase involved in cell wall biosynthesis
MYDHKRILIINYYWPPCGGPAVQRWLDFANRFAADKFEVHILTVSPETATFTSIDQSLVKEINSSIKVHYADASDYFWLYKKFLGKGKVPGNALADEVHPNLLKKIARFLRGNIFLPDPRRGWNANAKKEALSIIKQNEIDIIITAGPPQSTHLIGLDIKRQFQNLFWIADFHDYWTDVFFLDKFYRTRLARWVDRKYEKSVLVNANHVLTHTDYGQKLYYDKVKGERTPNFISVVRMGYDEQKFSNIEKTEPSTSFKITYTGTLADYYDPECVWDALNDIIEIKKDLDIELHLVGIISPKIKAYIEKSNLKKKTFFHGYIPHRESIKILLSSNLLLLFNPNVKNDIGIVPGKIFEYMATGIPILSISSHGSENEKLLKQHDAGVNFERHEVCEIIASLNMFLLKWKSNSSIQNLKMPYSRQSEYLKLKDSIQ